MSTKQGESSTTIQAAAISTDTADVQDAPETSGKMQQMDLTETQGAEEHMDQASTQEAEEHVEQTSTQEAEEHMDQASTQEAEEHVEQTSTQEAEEQYPDGKISRFDPRALAGRKKPIFDYTLAEKTEPELVEYVVKRYGLSERKAFCMVKMNPPEVLSSLDFTPLPDNILTSREELMRRYGGYL